MIKSWENSRPIILVSVVVVLLLGLGLLNPALLRALLAVPFVLFVPGFLMTYILFERDRLGLPERLMMSVGLSIAITALLGLVLNFTPWGLQTASLWAAFMIVMVLELFVMLVVRRVGWTRSGRLEPGLNFDGRQWALIILAVLVGTLAVGIARAPSPQQGLDGYTMLWLQPVDTAGAIRIGVKSEEFQTIKYQLKLDTNGVVQDGPTIELRPGETWEGELPLPKKLTAKTPVTILLYRLDRPTDIYRRVVWWPKTQ